MNKQYVSLLRVSTKIQGEDGNGIRSQREINDRYIQSQNGDKLAEFVEVITGKYTDKDRPQLAAALQLCRKVKATLIISKIDRLSRNAAFLLQLQQSGCDFVACDCPTADKFTVGVLALLASRERELISERTIQGMRQAALRGSKIGCVNPALTVPKMNEGARKARVEYAAKMSPVIGVFRSLGITTLRGISDALNRLGHVTRQNKTFTPSHVWNLLQSIQTLPNQNN